MLWILVSEKQLAATPETPKGKTARVSIADSQDNRSRDKRQEDASVLSSLTLRRRGRTLGRMTWRRARRRRWRTNGGIRTDCPRWWGRRAVVAPPTCPLLRTTSSLVEGRWNGTTRDIVEDYGRHSPIDASSGLSSNFSKKSAAILFTISALSLRQKAEI